MNFFKDAIEIHGEQAQLDMIIEECAELIKAIQKYKRVHYFIGKDETAYKFVGHKELKCIFSIIEEATDVDLMIKQLRYIFQYPNNWKVIRRDKVKRLIKNLERSKKK